MGTRDLLSEHLPRLYRTAWMLTKNEADAQDLAHDTMVSALTSLGRFRAESRVSTWLIAILINRYRAWRRSGAVRMASKRAIESCWPTPASEPEAELIAWEETIALKRALDRLDEEERLLVTLSIYQGLDSKEIGGLVGRPPGTIRYQLHAAREKLRSILLENRSHDRQA